MAQTNTTGDIYNFPQSHTHGNATLNIDTTDDSATFTVTDGSYTTGTTTTWPATDGTITTYPFPAKPNSIESDESEIITKDGHRFAASLVIKKTALVIEYRCECCDVLLHSQVISEIPKSIIKEKCLSKLVRETK